MKKVTIQNIVQEYGNDFFLTKEISNTIIGNINPDYNVKISWGKKLNNKILTEYGLYHSGAYIVKWKSTHPINIKRFRGGYNYASA